METTPVTTAVARRNSPSNSPLIPRSRSIFPEPGHNADTLWGITEATGEFRGITRVGIPRSFSPLFRANCLPWGIWGISFESRRGEASRRGIRTHNERREGEDRSRNSPNSPNPTPGVARVEIKLAAMSGNVRSWSVGEVQ